MKKLRKFAGIILIISAVIILVLWEVKGREIILMDSVLAAKREIAAGEILDESMFNSVSVPIDAKAHSAVASKDCGSVNGKVITVTIPQNGQIPAQYIRGKEVAKDNDDSYFVIQREWIYMRSSALRRGDYADIISSNGEVDFGRYKIAFVKNAEEREVVDSGKAGSAPVGGRQSVGTDGNFKIDHVEIIADRQQYMAIKQYVESASGPSLILIRMEGQ